MNMTSNDNITGRVSDPVDVMVSQRIHEWFVKEKAGLNREESIRLQKEIDAMIANIPNPLPLAAKAWKDWTDFENDTSRHDPGLYIAMDMCAYAEWSAKKTLSLTDEEFVGVPRLIISIAS